MEKTATMIVTPFERTIRYNQEQNGFFKKNQEQNAEYVRNFLFS